MARVRNLDKLEEIYKWVKANPGSNRWDIARAVGLERCNIECYLASMEAAGMYLSEDAEGCLFPYCYCPTDKLLTTMEMARYLGLGKRKVQKLCRDGEIPAFKIGHQWCIERRRLEIWSNSLDFQAD